MSPHAQPPLARYQQKTKGLWETLRSVSLDNSSGELSSCRFFTRCSQSPLEAVHPLFFMAWIPYWLCSPKQKMKAYLPKPFLLILRFKTFVASIMRTSLFTEKVHHLSSMAHGIQGSRNGTRCSGEKRLLIELNLYSNNLLIIRNGKTAVDGLVIPFGRSSATSEIFH